MLSAMFFAKQGLELCPVLELLGSPLFRFPVAGCAASPAHTHKHTLFRNSQSSVIPGGARSALALDSYRNGPWLQAQRLGRVCEQYCLTWLRQRGEN